MEIVLYITPSAQEWSDARQKVCKERKKHPKNDHGKGYEYGIQYCQIDGDAERGTAFSTTIGR